MADLESVLADVSYLMAMERSKTGGVKTVKKLVLPDKRSFIKPCCYVTLIKMLHAVYIKTLSLCNLVLRLAGAAGPGETAGGVLPNYHFNTLLRELSGWTLPSFHPVSNLLEFIFWGLGVDYFDKRSVLWRELCTSHLQELLGLLGFHIAMWNQLDCNGVLDVEQVWNVTVLGVSWGEGGRKEGFKILIKLLLHHVPLSPGGGTANWVANLWVMGQLPQSVCWPGSLVWALLWNGMI